MLLFVAVFAVTVGLFLSLELGNFVYIVLGFLVASIMERLDCIK